MILVSRAAYCSMPCYCGFTELNKSTGPGLAVSRLCPWCTLTVGLKLPWTCMWWFIVPSIGHRHHSQVSVPPGSKPYRRNWKLRTWERPGPSLQDTERCLFTDLRDPDDSRPHGNHALTTWNLPLPTYISRSKGRDGTDCAVLKLMWKETSQMPEVQEKTNQGTYHSHGFLKINSLTLHEMHEHHHTQGREARQEDGGRCSELTDPGLKHSLPVTELREEQWSLGSHAPVLSPLQKAHHARLCPKCSKYANLCDSQKLFQTGIIVTFPKRLSQSTCSSPSTAREPGLECRHSGARYLANMLTVQEKN